MNRVTTHRVAGLPLLTKLPHVLALLLSTLAFASSDPLPTDPTPTVEEVLAPPDLQTMFALPDPPRQKKPGQPVNEPPVVLNTSAFVLMMTDQAPMRMFLVPVGNPSVMTPQLAPNGAVVMFDLAPWGW